MRTALDRRSTALLAFAALWSIVLLALVVVTADEAATNFAHRAEAEIELVLDLG